MRAGMLAAAAGIVASTCLARLPDQSLVVVALPLLVPLWLCCGRAARIAAACMLTTR